MTTTAGPMGTLPLEYAYHPQHQPNEDYHNFMADFQVTEQESDAFPWPNMNLAHNMNFFQQQQMMLHQQQEQQHQQQHQQHQQHPSPHHHHHPSVEEQHLHQAAAMHPVHVGQPTGHDVKPRLSKDQIVFLEQRFLEFQKPTTITKKGYAEQLGVPLEKINNWFQNRRAKVKQDAKKAQNTLNMYQQNGMSSVMNNHIYDPTGTSYGPPTFAIHADGTLATDLSAEPADLPNPPVLPSTPSHAEFVFGPTNAAPTAMPFPTDLPGMPPMTLQHLQSLPPEVLMQLARSGALPEDMSFTGPPQDAVSHDNSMNVSPAPMPIHAYSETPSLMESTSSGFESLSQPDFGSNVMAASDVDSMDNWNLVPDAEETERQMAMIRQFRTSLANGTGSALSDPSSSPANPPMLAHAFTAPAVHVDSSAAVASVEMPLAYPDDEDSMGVDSMDDGEMSSTSQPTKEASPTFKQPPQPSSFANRRAKRPAALGAGTLRSASYHSGVNYAGITKHAPKSPRISLHSSVLPRTHSSPLATPAAIAIPPSASTLAPPTPHTPQPEAGHWPPWQAPPSRSMSYGSRMGELSESDSDFQYISSPPHTPFNPMEVAPFGKVPFENPFQAEDTPPQSAPATQQTFPGNPFSGPGAKREGDSRFLGPQTQHLRQRSLGVQQHRRYPSEWLTTSSGSDVAPPRRASPQQQQSVPVPVSASTHGSSNSLSLPFSGVPMVAPSSEPETSHPLSRKASSAGSPGATTKDAELVVHQYEPPNPAAPGDRKAGLGEPHPRSLTWNNSTPESFHCKRSPSA